MMALWWLYSAMLAAALACVALAGEYGLRLFGRATRWVWVASLAAGLALPALVWVVAPARPAVEAGAPGLGELQVVGAPLRVSAAAPAPAPVAQPWWQEATTLVARADGWLPWLWLAASLLAAACVALSWVRLRRQRRGWAEAELDGMAVLVSDGVGPAVVGLRRARIVVPDWVLDEPEARRRMILAHEAEHLRAGDARLLTGSLAAAVLTPWNPAVWWQLRRLRLAAEVDCDARVVGRGADLRGYAGLLLDVGMRFAEGGAVAAFAEPRSLLARRLRALTAPLPPRRGWRAAAVTLGALAVAMVAWVTPRPEKPALLAAEPAAAQQAAADDGVPLPPTPTMPSDTPPPFTPPNVAYDVAPELTNRAEVVAALIRLYPETLRKAGIGGRTDVWLRVGTEGIPDTARVRQSSGRAELDSAALQVAQVMRFTPARRNGAPVTTWITLPVAFRTTGAGRDTPVTPYDTPPKLQNQQEVSAAVQRLAPPSVRIVSAQENKFQNTVLNVHVDETGRVTDVRVLESSGLADVDSAGVQVGRLMRFAPATKAGKPVAAWIEVGRPPAPPSPETIRSGPVFTPYTVAPALANRAEVMQALVREYPPAARAAGDSATVLIWELIDESGKVEQARIKRTSGKADFDSAALRVGRGMVFTPALNRDKPVPVWVALPIIFRSAAQNAAAEAARRAEYEGLPAGANGMPGLPSGYSSPEMANQAEFLPFYLSSARPGMQVPHWAWVNVSIAADGSASGISLARSSGNAEWDRAALAIVRRIRWTPARNAQGQPAAVTIAVPIQYRATPAK